MTAHLDTAQRHIDAAVAALNRASLAATDPCHAAEAKGLALNLRYVGADVLVLRADVRAAEESGALETALGAEPGWAGA